MKFKESETVIRKMIRETDEKSYEKLRSIEQELAFTSAAAEFSKRGVEFGPAQMATLGLVNTDGIYTNLALLLSDQCPHTIKVAVFQDETQRIYLTRHEFGGSLLKQINEAYDFLDVYNKTSATIDKLVREDKRDYPAIALREALINAIVHREYAVRASILVKMFSDRVEFISLGGLVGGIEIGDIMSGISVCRNDRLAAVFYRLRLIEAFGTGIANIFDSYKASFRQPKIELGPNVFKVILPNEKYTVVEPSDTARTPESMVLDYIREYGSINRRQAQELLGLSQTAAGLVLRKLTEGGKLRREGGSRNSRYVPSQV
ncbi:MAG: AAA family ATPase [Deltaproteobacteria bacterium]|jgi:ATP-dependent DNA helicase RecG|nr:AAA family ATPase [Deltaproteobacteria bacterium]